MGLIRPQDMAKFASMARKEALPMDKRVENALRDTLNKFYAEQTKIQREINANEAALVESEKLELKKFEDSVILFGKAVKEFFVTSTGKVPPPPKDTTPPKGKDTSFSPNDIPISQIKQSIEDHKKDRNATGGPKNVRPLERKKETKRPDAPQRTQQKEDRLSNYLEDLSKPPKKSVPRGGKAFSDMIEKAIREGEAAPPPADPNPGLVIPPEILAPDKPAGNGQKEGWIHSILPKWTKDFWDKYRESAQEKMDDHFRKNFDPGGASRGFGPGLSSTGGPAGEPARGELLVNIAPQQVVLNIPELQKMTNDALTKIAMKKISVVFRDFAEELQGARDVSDIYTAVLASVEQHEGTDQVLGESADMSAMA